MLFKLLDAFGQKNLWAAVGWFLDTYRSTFYISDDELASIEEHLPKAPFYLVRDQRGGELVRRWNLIIPEELATGREPDESWQ